MRRPFSLITLVLLAAAVVGSAYSITAGPRANSERSDCLSLHDVARDFGMEAAWKTQGERLQLSGRTANAIFTADSREIYINHVRVFLGEPVLLHRNSLRLSRIDFDTTIRPILQPGSRVPHGTVRTIVLDPGHGGRDPGTRSESLGLLEKDLTLIIAQRLARALKSRGYDVVLTRTDDSFVSLDERARLANAADADLFVSIHFNAVGNATVQGIETYILTPGRHRSTGQRESAASDAAIHAGNQNDHWNALLGFLVHRQLLRDLQAFDRGLKRARFQVLRGVNSPAVLVEGGYLTNDAEAARIARPEYQVRLAESLADAIDRYRMAIERFTAER